MDDVSAFLLQLPLMLILFAVAMALAARLKSRRLADQHGQTQAENVQLRSQTATYESSVKALELQNKTLTDGSTSNAEQNRLLAQQVKQLTAENTDLRYNRDVAYQRLESAEADYVRRYLQRQCRRWFQMLRDHRCRTRTEIGVRVFYPMLRFLGYGEEAFDAEDPLQTLYASYRVYAVTAGGQAQLLFMLRAVDPGVGITEAFEQKSDADAYLAGAQKFVLVDADTFVLYRVGPDKRPVVRCLLVDLESYWSQIYAELAPSAFGP